MIGAKIDAALVLHQQWIKDQTTGARASFPGWDLRGIDFSRWDLTGINLRRCELTGCRFPAVMRNANLSLTSGKNVDFATNKTDLTGSNFHNSDLSGFDLVGATWGGSVLVAPPYVFKDYWCMVTDTGLQTGCSFYTMEQARNMDAEELKRLDPDFEQGPIDWWSRNKQRVFDLAAAYAALRKHEPAGS